MFFAYLLIIGGCNQNDDMKGLDETRNDNVTGEMIIKIDHRHTARHPFPLLINDTVRLTNGSFKVNRLDLQINSVCLTDLSGDVWCDTDQNVISRLQNNQEVHLTIKSIPRGEYRSISLQFGALDNEDDCFLQVELRSENNFHNCARGSVELETDWVEPLYVSPQATPAVHYYFFVADFLNENQHTDTPMHFERHFTFDHIHN